MHPSGVCGQHQRVLAGDRLVAFNGISLKGVSKEICNNTLQKRCTEVTLKVLRQHQSRYDVPTPNVVLSPTNEVTQNEIFAQKNVKLAYMRNSFRGNPDFTASKNQPIEEQNTLQLKDSVLDKDTESKMEKGHNVTRILHKPEVHPVQESVLDTALPQQDSIDSSTECITMATNFDEETKDDLMPVVESKIVTDSTEDSNVTDITSAINFDSESVSSVETKTFVNHMSSAPKNVPNRSDTHIEDWRSATPSSDFSSSPPPPLPSTPAPPVEPSNLKSSKLWEVETLENTIDMRYVYTPSVTSEGTVGTETPEPSPKSSPESSLGQTPQQSPVHNLSLQQNYETSQSDAHHVTSQSGTMTPISTSSSNVSSVEDNHVEIYQTPTSAIWRPTAIRPQQIHTPVNDNDVYNHTDDLSQYPEPINNNAVNSDGSDDFVTNIDDVSFDDSDNDVSVNMNYDLATQNLTTEGSHSNLSSFTEAYEINDNISKPSDSRYIPASEPHANGLIVDDISSESFVDFNSASTMLTDSRALGESDNVIIPSNSSEFQHALIDPFEALEREYDSDVLEDPSVASGISRQNVNLCMSTPVFPQPTSLYTTDPTTSHVSPATPPYDPPPALPISPPPCDQSAMGYFPVHDFGNNMASEPLNTVTNNMSVLLDTPKKPQLEISYQEKSIEHCYRSIDQVKNMEENSVPDMNTEKLLCEPSVNGLEDNCGIVEEEVIVPRTFQLEKLTDFDDIFSRVTALGSNGTKNATMSTNSVNISEDKEPLMDSTSKLDKNVNKELVQQSIDVATMQATPQLPTQDKHQTTTIPNKHDYDLDIQDVCNEELIVPVVARKPRDMLCSNEENVTLTNTDSTQVWDREHRSHDISAPDGGSLTHEVSSTQISTSQSVPMVSVQRRNFPVTIAEVDKISVDVVEAGPAPEDGGISEHSSDSEDNVKDYHLSDDVTADNVTNCDNNATYVSDNSNVCDSVTMETRTSFARGHVVESDSLIQPPCNRDLLNHVELDPESSMQHTSVSSDSDSDMDVPPLPFDAPPPVPTNAPPPLPLELTSVSSLDSDNTSIEPQSDITLSHASSLASSVTSPTPPEASHIILNDPVQPSLVTSVDSHLNESQNRTVEPITIDTQVRSTSNSTSSMSLMSPRPFQSPKSSVSVPVLKSPLRSPSYQTLPILKPLPATSFALSKVKSLSSSNLNSDKDSGKNPSVLRSSYGGSTHSLFGGGGLFGRGGGGSVVARVKHRRSATEPFQIEVLNSRFGLGLTVAPDADDKPVISKIETSGSIARNGNIK